MVDGNGYSIGLMKQFEDVENLKRESLCRQAIGNLRKQQYVIINERQEKGTLFESVEYASKLERLKAAILAVFDWPGFLKIFLTEIE
mgnify:CR=1 FL=1